MLTATLISVALLIFLAGNAARVIKTLRMPAHLRWELYPIPKGPKARQRYGGSYFEESDWWTKPLDTSHTSEVAFVLKEVFLLRGVWESFRGLWVWSWLLHWGLYLYVLATLLAVGEVLLPASASLGMLHAVVTYSYWLACPLGLAGTAGLLGIRAWHPRVRAFTTRSSMFNLVLLESIFATGMLLLTAGPVGLDHMISDLVRFPAFPGNHPAVWHVHVALLVFFLVYFPFTHMTHAYMKYFTWHQVRWDDSPITHDPHAAESLAVNLERKTSWAAPHIVAGGTATWSEVVADADRSGAGKRA
jgi:nitrate reductase gamma subunit